MRRLTFLICALLFLSACGHRKIQVQAPQPPPIQQSPQPGQPGQPGQPVPPAQISAEELEGLASYYAEPYHLRKTANGETFDTYKDMTAAHRTLPFNTFVRVTNKTNGRAVDVRINDRGPFVDGRVIDLSVRAAREIDLVRPGVAPVKLTILKLAEVTKPVFAVQVGAFENRSTANQLKQQLEKKYAGVTVQTVSDQKTFYRVRIAGPDLETANHLAVELQQQNFKPIVVRLN